MQLNVQLRRLSGDPLPNATELLSELARRLPALRRGGLTSFFFMRKLPDMRLRFATRGARPRVRREVAGLLDELTERRVVMKWFESCYEPEVHQLGGPLVVDLVHDHFDTDSRGYIEWIALEARGEARLTADVASLATLNDLFFRVVSGTEVWDVWRNVEALHASNDAAGDGPAERIAPVRVTDVMGLVTPKEARILERYAQRNQRVAAGLERLWRAGKLLYGRRSVLPFLAVWHWNRWGFDARRRARLYRPMVAALDPRTGLYGREPS